MSSRARRTKNFIETYKSYTERMINIRWKISIIFYRFPNEIVSIESCWGMLVQQRLEIPRNSNESTPL